MLIFFGIFANKKSFRDGNSLGLHVVELPFLKKPQPTMTIYHLPGVKVYLLFLSFSFLSLRAIVFVCSLFLLLSTSSFLIWYRSFYVSVFLSFLLLFRMA